MEPAKVGVRNRLLAALRPGDLALLSPALELVPVRAGDILFEPGEDVAHVCFPGRDAIGALVLDLRGGEAAEVAMVGCEGAIGGIISEGNKPAFARGVIQMGGAALRLPIDVLDHAKQRSASLRDHFARYADCLLAQLLQSVACSATHGLDARLARWLLTLQDRLGISELRVTQAFIAEMLGVRRTYATRIIGDLERLGALRRTRGAIVISDRRKLEGCACECYGYLRRHFERVLPGVYPS